MLVEQIRLQIDHADRGLLARQGASGVFAPVNDLGNDDTTGERIFVQED